MSADDLGIHNASCENHTPCVFPIQVWHQLIFPEAVLTGHSIYHAYVIGDHVFPEAVSTGHSIYNAYVMGDHV